MPRRRTVPGDYAKAINGATNKLLVSMSMKLRRSITESLVYPEDILRSAMASRAQANAGFWPFTDTASVPAGVSISLPTIAEDRRMPAAEQLLSYGPDDSAVSRRSAYIVDRILRGAKPGDIPIEQPTKFDLVINLKTAEALGLTIPPSILARAEVI